MDSLNRQLKKGVLDIVILNLLRRGRMYGYMLMTALSEIGGGFFAMKEGTLYPILYRLEDAGYIVSQWETDPLKRGLPRKYYSLSGAGREYLKDASGELSAFIDAIKMIMEVENYGSGE